MRLLITGPSLADPGGVAGYYRNILPCLDEPPGVSALRYVEVGSSAAGGRMARIIGDQRRVRDEVAAFTDSGAETVCPVRCCNELMVLIMMA